MQMLHKLEYVPKISGEQDCQRVTDEILFEVVEENKPNKRAVRFLRVPLSNRDRCVGKISEEIH